MLGPIRAYFQLKAHGTTLRRDVIAGMTTFVTMSYIIVVNPAILRPREFPPGPQWSQRS